MEIQLTSQDAYISFNVNLLSEMVLKVNNE